MRRFLSRSTIEWKANDLLFRYSRACGAEIALPVSAESILDTVLSNELGSILWDEIPEASGSTVLGCLDIPERQIILNETHRELLLDTPGLINTTIAHEIGHWILHAEECQNSQVVLPGFDTVPHENISTSGFDERNAHRFMSYLLMPKFLVLPLAARTNLESWPGLYELRAKLDVTITSLKIRLEELGLTYVDKNGVFHKSRAEAAGQIKIGL